MNIDKPQPSDIEARLGLVNDITERRQAERTLHHIMEGAHCLLWQAEVEDIGEERLHWKMYFASEEASQRFLPLHVSAERLYAGAWYLARLEEDRERVDRYGEQEIRAGRSYQQEFRCRSKDGALHWLCANVRVETLGEGKWRCTGVCTDITERKLAEEALRQANEQLARSSAQTEERFRLLVEGVQDYAIFILDTTGHVVTWNGGAERMKGYRAEEIIGKNFSCFFTDEDIRAGKPEQALQVASVAGHYEDEGWRVRKDGSQIMASVGLTALRDESGRLKGFAKIARDVTETRKVEVALREAKEQAETANQAKSEFLSRMSHELRTPLNAILGFGQILDAQSLTPLQKESVQYILIGGRHLLSLINEILDLAGVKSGRLTFSLEPIALTEIVPASCALVRPLAAERAINLEADIGALEDSYVLADHQRLKQVLLNLLSNAIKYNKVGGQVRVHCFLRPENRLAIAVQDTGPGISVEDQQKLFLPFERLSASLSEVEGTGLGLVMAQRLVIAMGGSLTLESLPGEGSTFFIELPLVPSPLDILAEHPVAFCESDRERSEERSATILYIEDNLSNMRLLEVLLRSRPGTTLLTAMQGSIGLDLARRHEPDLILLDLNLPDISGREVLFRLQASALTRDIPVVILSADATATQIERLRSAGARAYLTKPLDVAEFLNTLEMLLPAKKADILPNKESTI